MGITDKTKERPKAVPPSSGNTANSQSVPSPLNAAWLWDEGEFSPAPHGGLPAPVSYKNPSAESITLLGRGKSSPALDMGHSQKPNASRCLQNAAASPENVGKLLTNTGNKTCQAAAADQEFSVVYKGDHLLWQQNVTPDQNSHIASFRRSSCSVGSDLRHCRISLPGPRHTENLISQAGANTATRKYQGHEKHLSEMSF